MERKIRKVKIELYEDKADEFLALLYCLKDALQPDSIEQAERFYKKTDDFHQYIKDYLYFLRDFVAAVHIPTLDSKDSDIVKGVPPPTYLAGPFDEDDIPRINFFALNEVIFEKTLEPDSVIEAAKVCDPTGKSEDEILKELTGISDLSQLVDNFVLFDKDDPIITTAKNRVKTHPLFEEVSEFINKGHLPKLISEERISELTAYVIYAICRYPLQKERSDPYYQAASKYVKKLPSDIPNDLRNKFLGVLMFGFRNIPGVAVDSNPKKKDHYYLEWAILDEIEFYFPELLDPSLEDKPGLFGYQHRLITGYIASHLGILHDEETFLETNKSGDWRDWLAERVGDHMKTFYGINSKKT